MPLALRLLLAVFACYRIASLVAKEEGPWGIFKTIRLRAGAYDYGPDGLPETNLGRGISCPLCVGVYAGFGLAMLIAFPNYVGEFLVIWFGISGAQVFLENLTSDEAIQGAIQSVAESLEEKL